MCKGVFGGKPAICLNFGKSEPVKEKKKNHNCMYIDITNEIH